MRDANPIRTIIDRCRRDVVRDHAIDALVRCAGAVETEMDCPLGALILQEATSGHTAPGRVAVRRAAQRVVDGTARLLDDCLLVGAVGECCGRRRPGDDCPLDLGTPESSAATLPARRASTM